MRKTIKTVLVMVLTVAILVNQGTMAYASEGTDSLQMYEERLEELNLELGTTYQLTPAAGENYEDMVAFFSAMSIEEFEEYIMECYIAEVEFDSVMDAPLENALMNGGVVRSTLDTQKYFYAANANYLYLKAYTTTVSGITIYTGDVDSAGYLLSVYPGYAATSYSTLFADDMRTVRVTYNCTKYLSKYVTDAVAYTLNVRYGAGAGDIYPSL